MGKFVTNNNKVAHMDMDGQNTLCGLDEEFMHTAFKYERICIKCANSKNRF